ncbi:glycosyltransferase family 39 protein [Inconstantimicrobium mannanitabidum]|uniref:Dolichyl-phosphate-mannose--protein mannosyltransferase n=1 Tax=Inconstantimicrobium mannanitabidum TaxID=1604901 RepID=A0ACB5RDD5_9CLOT|nr:glycosyltransferase family 39 protein [Clostridium sp. TW13]GKX67182.1 dolichyl-phosphate-mannose--protein mannosyltransferase [Clostridium sp. TW13]
MKKFKLTRERIALTAILILSAILNFTNLNIEGYSNEYYSAGVKSMLTSFKNFFFVSFDPTGYVTIDKPPVGFWMQAISAKVFGFNSWSIIFPQALSGVISVGILYCLVKRYFGAKAGLVSALCIAVTPIFVAASRNNTIDNQLVMVLLISAYFLFKSLESRKLRDLILSLVFVGIGFNVKMLEAYFIIPAIYVTYFIASKIEMKKRIINLTVCTVVLIAVSLSWAIVVDLIPASSRPYVGSSSNNSEIQLIVGHNGIERLNNSNKSGGKSTREQSMPNFGEMSGSDRKMKSSNGFNREGFNNERGSITNRTQDDKLGKMPSGMSNSMGGGKAGLTRLFSNGSLADQISWLLPFALFGFVAGIIKEKLKKPYDNGRKLSLIFWITYLVPGSIYFSFTKGLFHPYYLTMLSAPIAALVGIGLKYMWDFYKENTWKAFLLPAAFIVDGVLQLIILSYYLRTSSITKLLMMLVAALSFISAGVLIINKLENKQDLSKDLNFRRILVSLAMIGLLVTPTVWSGTTLVYKMSGSMPSAGLELSRNNRSNAQGRGIMVGLAGEVSPNTSKLISFLELNKTNEKYLLVTASASGNASSIILNTDDSVMALGGFMGSDKIINLEQFKNMVKNGEVRYILVDSMGTRGMNSSKEDGNSAIMNWAKSHGKLVDKSLWSDTKGKENTESNQNINSTDNSNEELKGQGFVQGGNIRNSELYDLSGSSTE